MRMAQNFVKQFLFMNIETSPRWVSNMLDKQIEHDMLKNFSLPHKKRCLDRGNLYRLQPLLFAALLMERGKMAVRKLRAPENGLCQI